MNLRIWGAFALLFLLLLGVAGDAQAQTYRVRGSGRYRVGSDAAIRLNDGSITFGSNSSFTCTFQGRDARRFELRGRYTGGGLHRDLTVIDGLGRPDTRGTGSVTFLNSRMQLRSILLDGRTNGRPFQLDFAVDETLSGGGGSFPGAGGNGNNSFSLSDSAWGRGRLDIGNQKRNVRRVRIDMRRNGDFELDLEGPGYDDQYFVGTWTQRGNEYRIDVTTRDGRRLKARGVVRLDANRRRLRTVEMENDSFGQNYLRLYFEAED